MRGSAVVVDFLTAGEAISPINGTSWSFSAAVNNGRDSPIPDVPADPTALEIVGGGGMALRAPTPGAPEFHQSGMQREFLEPLGFTHAEVGAIPERTDY